MVRTFLKVYMEIVSYFLFLQEQIKDIIIIGDWGQASWEEELESTDPKQVYSES